MNGQEEQLELEEFKPSNKAPKKFDPWITLNKKSGLISLNRALLDLIEFKESDTIKLHQNKKNNEDWYIEVVKNDGDGWIPRISKNSNGISFNTRNIVRNVFVSNSVEGDSAKFSVSNKKLVSGDKILYFIITKNNLNTNKNK